MNKLFKVLGVASIMVMLAGNSWGIDFDSILCLKGGNYISASAAGDVNGDSLDDLITNIPDGTGDGHSGYPSIYLGPLNDSVANILFPYHFAEQYVFGANDINNDGYKDVMVANGYGTRVELYFGGNPVDTSADVVFNNSSIKTYPQGIGDFNKDGYDDIAIPFVVGSTYYTGIYFGGTSVDTTRDVTLRGGFTTINYWRPIELGGDINGDNYSDVVTLVQDTLNHHDTLLIYYGDSIPHSTPDVSLEVDSIADFSIRGDVNGDGYSDVVVCNYYGAPVIFLGRTTFNTTPDIIFPQHYLLVSYVGDVNGDNYDDILFSSGSTAGNLFLGNNPVDTVADWSVSWGRTELLGSTGDIDNDGNDEFFTGKAGRTGPTEPPYLTVWHYVAGAEEKKLSIPKNKLSVSANPFTQSTVIEYSLQNASTVSLKIYDVRGNLVKTLINNTTNNKGKHQINWSGDNDKGERVPAGTYFCKLNVNNKSYEYKITKVASTGGVR